MTDIKDKASPSPEAEFGPNAWYVSELRKLYESNHALVDSPWVSFFSKQNGTHGHSYTNGTSSNLNLGAVQDTQAKLLRLIDSYRRFGHLAANINPLTQGVTEIVPPDCLDFSKYDFSSAEIDKSYRCDNLSGLENSTVAQVTERLKQIYCGKVGFEFLHLSDETQRIWLQSKIESEFLARRFSSEQRVTFFKKVLESEVLDHELHTRFVGAKRFSLLGADPFAALMHQMFEAGAEAGIREAVMAMAHRGRIHALAVFAGKPLSQISKEFQDKTLASTLGAGDVKYHLGWTTERLTASGKSILITIPPNPSHLEFVDPVATGLVRARQDSRFADNPAAVMPVLIHGDSSFAGQGIVPETLNLATLKGYQTQGTVHVIINNQVGFTTNADETRSTTYSSDVAKGYEIPIFHVNADDVEACCWVAQLAVEFRQTFKRDVLIDLICARRYGHNEGDDPSFTQPLMYQELARLKSFATTYGERLVEEGILTQEETSKIKKDFELKTKAELDSESPVKEVAPDYKLQWHENTAVNKATLEKIATSLTEVSQQFNLHPKLKGILQKRVASLTVQKGIDWGLSEALAYGSLLLEGKSVRLSGQDSGRGTFSHRHLELHDYSSKQRYLPLQGFAEREKCQVRFQIFNSPLSEAAVLGFEFGYSSELPSSLVMWEAQFGDFANGAQAIIDQFICSSEQKWGQRSGVVMLLPHGFEGQGPEHSSARLERFLQMCSHNNITVVSPTNGAQFFHLIRRHAHSQAKRPLVVMTPKSLLRMPEAGVSIEDFSEGKFNPIIVDGSGKNAFLCTGKVYYDLKKRLAKEKIEATIIRVEQLYPWPANELGAVIKDRKFSKVIWVQEEPENMGAYRFVQPLLESLLGKSIFYAGRPSSAGVSTGSPGWHLKEVEDFLSQCVASLG